jgi:hypothetical protein
VRGVNFQVHPLSSNALSPMMLPLLEIFLELLLWNSFQCHWHYFVHVQYPEILVPQSRLFSGNSQKSVEDKQGKEDGYSISVIDSWTRNCLTECLLSCSTVMVENPIARPGLFYTQLHVKTSILTHNKLG